MTPDPKESYIPLRRKKIVSGPNKWKAEKTGFLGAFEAFFWLIRAANAPLTQHFVIFCGIFKAAQKWPQKVPQRSTKGCAKGATRRWPKNATKSHKVSFLRRFWCVYMRKNDKNQEKRFTMSLGKVRQWNIWIMDTKIRLKLVHPITPKQQLSSF